MLLERFDVVIVGGGASGALTATHLLRRSPGLSIAIIEPRETLGQGIAYGTPRMEHRLNVRAKGMTSDPANPGDFVAWLEENGHPSDPEGFVPRPLFGRYVKDRLNQAGDVTHVRAKASTLLPPPASGGGETGYRIEANSVHYEAPQVVIATGNLPPVVPSGLRQVASNPNFIRDPWSYDLAKIGHDEEVLIVGSGLTMIDLTLELLATGHRGKVRVVSRRGLLPHRHEHTESTTFALDPEQSVRQWVKAIRNESTSKPWRAVIDALRPQTQNLWRSMSKTDRARFLRHLVPYWDAHRHRLDPAVGAHAAKAKLELVAGWITDARDAFEVDVTLRWGGQTTLKPNWILLATGPRFGATNALLGDAELTPEGEVVGREGLYAMGPLLKGVGWETTAIPEIRVQAARIAEKILARTPSPAK